MRLPGSGVRHTAPAVRLPVVTTLAEALSFSTGLNDPAIEWLHYVVGDWQLDRRPVLRRTSSCGRRPPTGTGGRSPTYAPTPGPWCSTRTSSGTVEHHEPPVDARRGVHDPLDRPGKDPVRREELAVREEAVPVVRAGEALAVITRHTNVASARTPSRLEPTYRRLADALTRMIAAGEFPSPAYPTGLRRGAPRVGDGVIHLDVEGLVRYASPNAISAIHRLGHRGDVVGEVLAQIVADLLQRSTDPRRRVARARPHRARSVAQRGRDEVGERVDAGHPAHRGRRPGGGDAPRARRLGAAPARAGADDQGRDDPGDPPPGQEQPPDGRRAAAATGAPPARGRRQGGPGGGGAAGRDDRARPRDARPGVRRDGELRRGGGAGAARGRGGRDERVPGRVRAARLVRSAAGRGRHLTGPGRVRAGPERRGARPRRHRDGHVDVTAAASGCPPGRRSSS